MPNQIEKIYGDIPPNWKYVTVAELIDCNQADLQTGPFGTALLASEYQPVGTPVIAVKNIGQNKILLDDDIPRVNEDKRQELQRYTLEQGDIVFGRKGAVDRRAIVTSHEEGWLQGSDCIRLRFLEPNIDPHYVSYILGTPQHISWIIRNAGGSTMPSLNQRIIGRISIPIPPLEEQRAIADVLGSLDDKIEANRRQNETLEATARAIFKSWFVDFDPVHAKARSEHPAGMDAETAALFPDSFEESELGLIPRGWGVMPLDHIADYLNGLVMQKYPADGADYLPVIKIRELRQGFTDNKSGQASTEIDSKYIVEDGDVIFSWSGSLLVDIWTGGIGGLNQHLFKVTSDDFPRWFYYFWTKYHLEEFQRIAASKATTMGHIKRSHLREALVVVPLDNLLQMAHLILEPMIEKVIGDRLQSRTLAETRDALLPRLVSGELRVGEMEDIP